MLKFYTVEFVDQGELTQQANIAIDNLVQLDIFLAEIGLIDELVINKKSSYTFNKYYYDLQQQLLLLLQLQAVINNNIDIGNVFIKWFELKKDKKRLNTSNLLKINKADLSFYLQALGFKSIVIEIIKASSQADEGIRGAIVALESEISSNNQTKNTINSSLVKIVFALVTLFSMPTLIKATAQKQSNSVIDALLWIDNHMFDLLIVLSISVFLIYIYKESIQKTFKNIYPISLFINIVKIKASLLLTDLLLAANTSGLNHVVVVEKFGHIDAFCKKQAKILLSAFDIDQLGLSEALNKTDLNYLLISGMSNFDQIITQKSKQEVLKRLKYGLKQSLIEANNRLIFFANTLTYLILIMMVFILFIAIMLPRFNAVGASF